jgi:DNA-binding protein HU-beta
MNKTELIEKLAKKTGLTLKDAGMAVNTIFDATPGKGIIAVELDAGGKVTLPGFGTFKTVHREERTGINPKTKETITIPAKNYAVFKAGKTLKDRVSK